MSLMNVVNNVAGLVLAQPHSSGSGSFTIASGAGSLPAPPFRLTAITAASYQTSAEVLTIYECTAVNGSVLTVAAIEGTSDRAFAAGDKIDLRPTAGTISDLNAIAAVAMTALTTTGTSGPATFASGTLNVPEYGGGGGSGTVTTVSVATANGFQGTVSNPATTPAITLQTTVAGLLKGSAAAIVAATAGTDYQAPLHLTTTGSSGPATFDGSTLNVPEYGGGGAITLTTTGVNVEPTLVGSTLNVVQYAPVAQVFTSSGTYPIPLWATYIRIQAIGAGGGGGSGAVWSTGTPNSAWGGSGGAGGAACEAVLRAADLISVNGSSNVTVTIGAGGGGGAAASAAGNGNAGGAGGDTKFGASPFLWAPGGAGGAGGTISASAPAYSSGAIGQYFGGNGRNSSGSGASPTGTLGGGGGGGGGEYDYNGNAYIGTPSNPCTGILGYPANDYASPSGTPGAAGTNGANRLGSGLPMFAGAQGASGGNAGPTGSNGGKGGNGGLFGGGGGGGGACGNGMTSGAGGGGGGGLVIVWAW